MHFGTSLIITQVLLSYIWPVGIRRLQLRGVGLILCLISVACLNVLIPRQIGIIIDACIAPSASIAWASVLILAFLCYTVSAAGLGLLRQWLWTPLRSFATESMICSVYSHILNLSANFHESRSTPGTSNVILAANGISGFLETVLIKAIPALLDIAIAVIYLSVIVGSFQGLIIAAIGITFFLLATRFIKMSTTYGRCKNEALATEISTRHKGLAMRHDSDAVDQTGYEDNSHTDVVAARQVAEIRYELFCATTVAIETAVILLGLGASGLLAVHHVWTGRVTPGQLAMLFTYWFQLSVSLISLAKQGKCTSDVLIEAEQFVKIMTMTPAIKNRGKPLKYSKGDVEFNQVCFEYSNQAPIIKNFNFRIAAGQTVVLVGPHGAGKSTLLKLLRRSYDVTQGSILIDGQDIRGVDLRSLRDRIGVVPQSPVLFNDTIMNNIRYGRITANDEEVYAASKTACIHQRIQSLSQGYSTMVGEYGVKLSSGEIQLIAIARAILKHPGILILDGATSALDEHTERQLHASLSSLSQDLTKFIVTNRPATIMKADLILVIGDGQILEQGTHEHIFRVGGKYSDMLSTRLFCSLAKQVDHSDDTPVGSHETTVEPRANEPISDAATVTEANKHAQEVSATKEVCSCSLSVVASPANWTVEVQTQPNRPDLHSTGHQSSRQDRA